MNPIGRHFGGLYEAWIGGPYEAWKASGVLGWLLLLVWVIYPVAVVTCYYPSDAVAFYAWLLGLAIPEAMTFRMMIVGEIFALLFLAILSLLQLGIVTLIYRRAGFYCSLWLSVTILIGGIVNGIWWLWTGEFDPIGALAGFSPVAAAVVCHGLCERLGGNLAFGPGPKPRYQPGY